jgi:hypothetical protein
MSEGANTNPDGEQFTSHIDKELRDLSAGMVAAEKLREMDRLDAEQSEGFRVPDALSVDPDGQVREEFYPTALEQREIRKSEAREAVVAARGEAEASGRHRRNPDDQAPEELRGGPRADGMVGGRHRAPGGQAQDEAVEPRSAREGLSSKHMDPSEDGQARRRAAVREVVRDFGDREFKQRLVNGELHGGDVGAVQQMALAAEHSLSKADKARAKGQHQRATRLEARADDEMAGAEFAHTWGTDIRKQRRRPWQLWRR